MIGHPKPKKKPKKVFGTQYWSGLRNKSIKKQQAEIKDYLNELKAWHRKIYDKHKGICAESGRHLQFSKSYCAHLLPKSLFAEFSTDERNGILLDLEFHSILDKGSPKQRHSLKVWNFITQRRKELLGEIGQEYDASYWENVTF